MHPPLQKMYKRKEKKQSIKNDRVLDGIVSRTLSDLVENHTLNPNRAPTRSLQAKSSASHADSYKSIPVCHQTHTPNSRTCQLGVSENPGFPDPRDGIVQTMPSSVRGSALAFAVQQSGYSQGFLLFVLPAHQAAVWWTA